MKFIKQCFEQNQNELANELCRAGFTPSQVSEFLPEVVNGFVENSNIISSAVQINNLLSEDPDRLLTAIDAEKMSGKLGVSTARVWTGLQAIAPVLSAALLKKNSNKVSLGTSYAWGWST